MKRLTQHNLTKSQMKIADYVAKNQKRIIGLTAKQAGGEIGVSDATMIRFARALGYEGCHFGSGLVYGLAERYGLPNQRRGLIALWR